MEITEKSFLCDAKDHQMTVIRDDGIYRDVAFKRPDTSNMSFNLITWPMYLCYTGDMGTYVFRRTADMFSFFRTSHPVGDPQTQTLKINPGYWAEKLEAVDSADGVRQYSADKFREYFSEWMDEHEASPELRERIKSDILYHADDGPQDARRAAMDFEQDGRNPFQDFWEVSIEEYTTRFIWACYAIAWGIAQYDLGFGRNLVTATAAKKKT